MVYESSTKSIHGCQVVARAWSGLTEDPRTTDFWLGLFVLVLLRITSYSQLCTYPTDWLTCPEILLSDCRGLTPTTLSQWFMNLFGLTADSPDLIRMARYRQQIGWFSQKNSLGVQIVKILSHNSSTKCFSHQTPSKHRMVWLKNDPIPIPWFDWQAEVFK